jgi:hypothetical protein
MRAGILLLVVAVGTAACGLRSPGTVTSGSAPDVGPAAQDQRRVETLARPLEVVAGETVRITCVVTREGEHLPSEPTAVTVTPSTIGVVADAVAWTMAPTVAGSYLVQCKTADDAVVDGRGVHVEVLPAPTVAVETVLSTPSAEAGVPVDVTCEAYDTFGNLVEEAPAPVLLVDAGLLVDPPSGAGFKVRGTIAGDYGVACEIDGVVDATPEELTVVPGIPASSETTVDLTSIGPADIVNVSCEVFDAYGNPLPDAATELAVVPASGSSAAQDGLDVTATTMSATVMGTYYVFCVVPGYAAGDESPAIVAVNFGLPCTWAVSWPDVSSCYWQGRRLPVDYLVWDRWGNEVETAVPDLTAVPASGVVADGEGGFVFNEEGAYDLSLALSGPFDSECLALVESASQPSLAPGTIIIDSSGPVVVVADPPRAGMIEQGGLADATVALTGYAQDSMSPVVSFELLGIEQVPAGPPPIDTYVPGSVDQTSRWGLNIITGSAEDECGNHRAFVQSYLRGRSPNGFYDAYAGPVPPPEPPPGGSVAHGILAHMNQPVIDDGSRAPPVDDLLTILQAILDALDWDSLIAPGQTFGQDPLRGSCRFPDTWADYSYWVGRNRSTSQHILGAIVINYLRAVTGGLDFDIDVNGLSVPIEFEACVRECVVGIRNTDCVNGTLRVNGSAATDGGLGIGLAGGSAQVTVPSLNVNVSDMSVSSLSLSCSGLLSLFCGLLEGLIESAINAALDVFESNVEAQLRDQIQNQIPAVVEDFLNGFSLDTDFQLPAPLDVTINMSSALDRVQFSGPYPDGYGQLGLYTQMFPAAHHEGTSPRGDQIPVDAGSIRKDTSATGDGVLPGFTNAYDFGLGLKDDLVNQLLWAMWYGGALDLDLAELGDVGGLDPSMLDIQLFALLPPVVMPGTNGNQVDIGLGDAYVDATVDLAALLGADPGTTPPLHVGMYLSTIIGGSIDLDPVPNELIVSLDSEPIVYVDVVEIDDDGYQAVMSDLFASLLRLIMPQLFAAAIGSFPIPDFDLGGVGGLPPGTVLRLTNGSLDRDGDHYFRLTGSLEQ